MKISRREIALVLLCLVLLVGGGTASEPNGVGPDLRAVKAVVIVCKGDIDDALYKSIRRRTEIALDEGVEYLIYEIGTYGGFLKSGDDISKYFVQEIGKKVRTIAYVTTEAISAGAMISVSCQDIIMRENTTIGDCAPITIGGKLEGVEREKVESFTRGAFDRAAKANGYPRALLRSMVTARIEVYRVKDTETGEYEFFEDERLTKDPLDPNKYDLDHKKLIVKKDELLTLIASDAVEYGVARAQVKDIDGVLAFLSERDGVRFTGEPMVLETMWSEEMVRWLNSPAVMAVLVMLAMLGVYMELNTPGVGLPGLVAVICVVIIIGSKHMAELANWVEVLIFVIGILLLLIEFLALPGFGIAGVLGILCIFAGLFGMLIKNPPDEVPWPRSPLDWHLFFNGVIGLSIGFVGFVLLAWLLAKYMPKIPFLRSLILVPTAATAGGGMRVSMTSPPQGETVSVKAGDEGEVVSALRPTGKARFADAIVDVVAEAEFLDKGTKVTIIEVHGNRVVVRAIEKNDRTE